MLAVLLEAIGAPAAALSGNTASGLVVARVNTTLAALLGCAPDSMVGEVGRGALPRAAVAELMGVASNSPIDTRLGPWALPYRAMIRPLPAELAVGAELLAVFLPQPSAVGLPLSGMAGLAPGDLGATALEVLDLQSEMVSRWRPDGTILYCNEAFARQCGRHLDEVIGANLFDLTPASEIEQIRSNIARLSAASPSIGYDHHITGEPDGRSAGRSGSIGHSSTRLGRVTGYLSVGRDITERKLAERRLAESERRLKLALEAGRQGVWELDVQSGRDQDRSGAGGAAAAAERRL